MGWSDSDVAAAATSSARWVAGGSSEARRAKACSSRGADPERLLDRLGARELLRGERARQLEQRERVAGSRGMERLGTRRRDPS